LPAAKKREKKGKPQEVGGARDKVKKVKKEAIIRWEEALTEIACAESANLPP